MSVSGGATEARDDLNSGLALYNLNCQIAVQRHKRARIERISRIVAPTTTEHTVGILPRVSSSSCSSLLPQASCVATFSSDNTTLSGHATSLHDLVHEHFLLSWHSLLIRSIICHAHRTLEAVGSSARRWATLTLLRHYALLHLLLRHHVLELSHRSCTLAWGLTYRC